MEVLLEKKLSVKKQPEITIVSDLRGFAALSVFLFHVVCVSNGYVSNKILYNIFYYGKYGVQFFFVISGFVITYSMLQGNYKLSNFFTFLKKRIIRIEPPYLVIVLLTVIFLIIRNKSGLANGNSEMPDLLQILLHIGYLIPFSSYEWISIVFWTLAIEFQFYLIFSLLFPIYVSNKWLRWGIQFLFIILFSTSFSESFFFHWAPVFLLGINLALFKFKVIKLFELIISYIVLSFMVFYGLGWEVLVFSNIPFFLIFWQPQLKKGIWDFFGRISYSLYLSHTLIAFAILNIGIRFTTHTYQKFIFVSLAIITTIIFSYFLYFFVEKPFKRIASSIKYSN
jgi:peptidoglycan/LPS O-acetylase OafA/YrhL